MTTHLRLFTFLFLSAFLVTTCFAQQITLTQNHKSGVYKKGEAVVFTLQIQNVETDSITVKIRQNYSYAIEEFKMASGKNEFNVFNEVFNQPSTVIVEVNAGDNKASLGAIVAPDEFQPGSKRPKDFDQFWANEKKALRALPLEIKRKRVDLQNRDFQCWDMELNCTGPKPARGYFAKPENAKPKSLPIVLFVHAAGVKGSWCLAQPEQALNFAKMGEGALAFDLNAHGILNGQSPEYYEELENNELSRYWAQGVVNRDEFYFKGMYLRLMRTIDFLTNQPEWDGKRILVMGESQGGGQALAAAGLDPRVNAVVATVPAVSGMLSHFENAVAGWPNPMSFRNDKAAILTTVPYFDTAHLLKDCKATIVTEIGLIDTTCPSYAVYSAINQSKGEKITFAVPYREHNLNQQIYQQEWQENVFREKQQFIDEFLQ